MKVVQACGCSYEKTPDGVIDELVCAFHTRAMFLFFEPTFDRRLAEAEQRCPQCHLLTAGKPHHCEFAS